MESKKETIFIIDDDPTNISILSEIFPGSYAIKAATSGNAALKTIILGTKPDIILLDIMIPDMDGYSVCERIKENQSLVDIPIIFISTLDTTIDKVRAFNSGAVDYITKPFQPEEVIARVETHLRLKRFNHQLQKNIVQLRELEQARDSLIHMIIHDMRSPLGAVSCFLEMIVKSPDDAVDDSLKLPLNKAYSAICIVIEMMNSILDIQKIENGKIQLNLQKNNIKKTISDAIELMGSLDNKCSISINEQDVDRFIKYDQDIIRRVILNLISNAVKYTPNDEIIIIRYKYRGTSLYISVTDCGPGISKEYHKKIFEKFEQVGVRSEGEMHSSGLGLTFCKMAVEAHGGTITVKNEKDKGCTFTVEIPTSK